MARKPTEKKVAEAADAVAAGAIVGAGAVAREGGDADQAVAGAIGGAAAAVEAATGDDEPSGVVPKAKEPQPEPQPEAAAEPPPPAPGDDAESVFDRRLERLARIVEDAEFESGTVFGDLRDAILDLFKHRPKVWSAMSAGEQQDAIRAVEAAAKRLLGKVVLVIAQEESDTIQGTLLGQFAVKGETIEAKLKIEHADSDVLADLYGMAGHKIVIVSADDKRFMSARKPASVDPDQTAMTFGDDTRGAAPAPKPEPQPGPEGDHDLVDAAEDDEEDGGEVEPGKAGDPPAAPSDDATFGVFDTQDGEWLVDMDADPEEWATDKATAKRFTNDEARRIAVEYGEGFEARLLD